MVSSRRERRQRGWAFEKAGSPSDFIVNLAAPRVPEESLWLAVDEAERLSRTFF